MFCPGCGNEILDGQKFCPKCGNTVGGGTVAVKNAAPVWESKVVQVAPSREDDTIDEYQAFGWELKNSQTIDKQDSHLENQFGTIYSVTESEKYVKLTFRRNKKMANYARLVELENKYYGAEVYEPEGPSGMKLGFGLFMLFGFFPIGIYLLYTYFRDKKAYDNEYDNFVAARNESSQTKYVCLTEAKKLIDG